MSNIQTINSHAVFIDLMEIEQNRFSEYISVLNEIELSKLETIKHPLKKLEFAAARYLKHKRFGNELIEYDETGAPHIKNGPFISLSHSKTHVILGFCKDYRIGVDIEIITDKSVLTQRRFITEKEKNLFNPDSPDDMTFLWSLKETMYKLSDRNELLFQTHLLVENRNELEVKASVLHQNGFHTYDLVGFRFPTFFITCNTGEGKQHETTR